MWKWTPPTTPVLPVNRGASPLDPGASAAANAVLRRRENVPSQPSVAPVIALIHVVALTRVAFVAVLDSD